MPFVDPYRPSIQLGLLKSVTARAGFPVRTLHAYLDFAVRIGVDDYQILCQHRGAMTGEWLFSVAAFPDTAPDPDGHFAGELARSLRHLAESPEKAREKLLQIRDVHVPAYLDAMLDAFPWHEVAVAGFSSTFQQNAASFALARRLKQRYPHLVTVFGGANFDGEMGPELVRSVGCIDVAVIGEGDETFPRLLGALAGRTSLDAVPGLARRLASPGGRRPGTGGPARRLAVLAPGRSGSRRRSPRLPISTTCPSRTTANTSSGRRTWGYCPASGTAVCRCRSRPRGAAGGVPSTTARSAG